MRVIVIGAGHNGLAAAFYLAKAGHPTVVLDAADAVGGGAVTGELHPGFRCPTLAHDVSLRADVVEDMRLERRGVAFLAAPADTFAPALGGPAALTHADVGRSVESLRALSVRDADRYARFRAAVADSAGVLAALLSRPLPDVDEPSGADLWHLFTAARRFRALDRRDAYALLRWGPMPVADFAAEWFETEPLRAVVAAPGLSGTMFGPRSAGSTLVLLLRAATRALADGRVRVRGGPGALTGAMAAAAREAGADIRTGTRVEQILVADGRVTGVAAGGAELPADAVVSAVDPKTTFLGLVDPVHLSPDFLLKIGGYRARGTLAKVNLALSGLPSFEGQPRTGADGASDVLSGTIHVGPDLDYLERAFDHAKYGEMSAEPWLTATIPSIVDDTLAPPGAHVMSIYVHYAPYALRDGTWADRREVLERRVLAVLERAAPGIGRLVVAAETLTPADLAARVGLAGGHVYHGELALDQLAVMRPVIGYSRYATPVEGLFLCSAGTHPGGFMSGGSGRMAAEQVLRSGR